jgi:hypothetical protein
MKSSSFWHSGIARKSNTDLRMAQNVLEDLIDFLAQEIHD